MSLLKKLLSHPKMYYPTIMFFVALTFGPVILLGGQRPVYAVWQWEGSHPEMPFRMELSGNILTRHHVTLTAYEGLQMMAPFMNPYAVDNSWINPLPYLPMHLPWNTRNVNEQVRVVDGPQGLGVNTNRYRGGMKAGFEPGVTQIVVQGRYELTDRQLVLIYETGVRHYFDIVLDGDTLTMGQFVFRRIDV